MFKSNNTLRQTLMHVKTTVLKERKQGVVYEVPCKECRSVYVGETGWNLQERIKEHRYAVKRHDMNNGISVHAWEKNHAVDWSEAKVRTLEQITWRRKILEAIHIHQEKKGTANLNCGTQLSPIWMPLSQRAHKQSNIPASLCNLILTFLPFQYYSKIFLMSPHIHTYSYYTFFLFFFLYS